jgi:hypothetical protein
MKTQHGLWAYEIGHLQLAIFRCLLLSEDNLVELEVQLATIVSAGSYYRVVGWVVERSPPHHSRIQAYILHYVSI